MNPWLLRLQKTLARLVGWARKAIEPAMRAVTAKAVEQVPDTRPPSHRTGHWGERIAQRHLVGQGFQILATNWRKGRHELDIVAQEAEVLVFVEVRTRRAIAKVPGYWSINAKKRRALTEAVRIYRQQLSRPYRTWRLDVVEIRYRSTIDFDLNHYRNVGLRKGR